MADEADDDGLGEYTTVQRTKKEEFIPVWRRGARTYVYRSEVFTKWAADRWNLYFKTITGKDMNFELTPRTLPYVSALECRRNLDVLLIPLMPKRPIIWDLTAGSGSDFVAYALFFNFAMYFGVDLMSQEDFAVFCRNVKKFCAVYPKDYPEGCIAVAGDGKGNWTDPKIRIRLQNSRAKTFINQYANYVDKELKERLVDCVYIDPPWGADFLTKALNDEEYRDWAKHDVNDGEALPISIEHEATPKILMNWIVNEVLAPMAAARPPIKCALLVLKVRFELTSVKMQDYLNLNPMIGQNFVVLYAVQSLQNIPQYDIDEKDGHKIITEKINGTRVERKVTKKNGLNIVKGQFHWLVLKNTEYAYVNDLKAKWYDNEMLMGKPNPMYVLRDSTMHETYKPTYSDRLPSPIVLTQLQWKQKPPAEQANYEQVGPVRARAEVVQEDISTYVKKFKDLQHKLEQAQSTGNVDMKEIVRKIQDILVTSDMYAEEIFNHTEGVAGLRVIMKQMQDIVTRYIQRHEEQTKDKKEIENQTDSATTGNVEPPPRPGSKPPQTDMRRGRMKGEFLTDLGALLQALQGLAAR